LNLKIENFPLEPRWGVEPGKNVILGEDCLRNGTFTVDVGWDIENVRHCGDSSLANLLIDCNGGGV
jgi:hypothetical protein